MREHSLGQDGLRATVDSVRLPDARRSLSKRSLAFLGAVSKAWEGCTRCPLSESRNKVVFWRGNPAANIILIGEAPGEDEDRSGRPFTGPAGRLLDAALRDAGLDPAEDVWIANQLGCRPPNNRRPDTEELRACRPRLYEMVKSIIGPKDIVLLLGATAGRLAGVNSVQDWRGEHLVVSFLGEPDLDVPGFITTHPSFVLRTGGRGSKTYQELVKDIKAAHRAASQ